jgi:hypothetical protein
MTIKIMPAEPEPELSEEYYETLARTMGDECAAWARLPREEREKDLRWYHENFNTPDDLSLWPPELGGGMNNA